MSFPYLIIVLSVMAVLGPGLVNVILSLSLIITATNSRVIRGATIAVAQHPYLEAARAIGCGAHAHRPPLHPAQRHGRRSSSWPPSASAASSWPSRRCPSSASACRRPIPRGAPCSPAPGAPTCSGRPGWRSGRAWPSRSPCSVSTCSATPSATCWTRACGARSSGSRLRRSHLTGVGQDRVGPHGFVRSRRQPGIANVRRSREDVGQRSNQPGREVLVEQKPHAGGSAIRRRAQPRTPYARMPSSVRSGEAPSSRAEEDRGNWTGHQWASIRSWFRSRSLSTHETRLGMA